MTHLRVDTGIERLLAGGADALRGRKLGLIAHPASVTSDLRFSADVMIDAGFNVQALFGPQHGARGEKQDNMIESDHYSDPVTGLPVHSLYSETRKPTPDMLDGLDALVFDLQDVGVRVYTFVWTMALAMEACSEAGVQFVVLDRPNPVGGRRRGGPILREGFESFVGLHPIPLRHGMTCGELALWLNAERGIDCDLTVVRCEGWRRWMHWPDTGLPWVLPSPNLPTSESCEVYPGMVLLEGTNLSEGRGTTRPFELFGAPYLDADALQAHLSGAGIRGATIRPCHFEPTFQKHANELCAGGQIHITDLDTFESVRATVEILRAARALAPEDFEWRSPPYEYEKDLMPIDILWGHDGLRLGIDAGASTDEILAGVDEEVAEFSASVESYLLYE